MFTNNFVYLRGTTLNRMVGLVRLVNKLDKLGLKKEAESLSHTIKVASSFYDTLESEINRVVENSLGRPSVRNLSEEDFAKLEKINEMISQVASEIYNAEESGDKAEASRLLAELADLHQLHRDLLSL